jgi:hypothetical protein
MALRNKASRDKPMDISLKAIFFPKGRAAKREARQVLLPGAILIPAG